MRFYLTVTSVPLELKPCSKSNSLIGTVLALSLATHENKNSPHNQDCLALRGGCRCIDYVPATVPKPSASATPTQLQVMAMDQPI